MSFLIQKNDLPVAAKADDIRSYLISKRDSYGRSARLWKMSTRCLLIVSVIFAGGAAVLPNIEMAFGVSEDEARLLTSLAAGVAALCSTILGTLKCEENFQFNRKQRHDVERILVELSSNEVNLKQIRGSIDDVLSERGNRE